MFHMNARKITITLPRKPDASGRAAETPRSEQSVSAKKPADREQAIYDRLKDAKRRFGLVRIEMGVLLDHIHKGEIWRGRGTSFAAFLEEEKINATAAYGYMRVARKFFGELQLSDSEFDTIANVSMSILDLASQVINDENKEEVIGYITILSERDAKQVLLEMLDKQSVDRGDAKPQRSNQVSKVLRVFRDLPDDQQIEFFHAIQGKK